MSARTEPGPTMPPLVPDLEAYVHDAIMWEWRRVAACGPVLTVDELATLFSKTSVRAMEHWAEAAT